MSEIDLKSALEKYLVVLSKGNYEEIIKEKYNLLWEVPNLLKLVTNYLACEKCGISFDFGQEIIPKGTKLFRIRSFDSETDFTQETEWGPPPSRPQNRANHNGQEALYLGSTETICLIETHIPFNQKYVLGTYECVEDIKVGGFLFNDPNSWKHNLAGIVLNAFLIAPARDDKNKDLFSFLDKLYGKLDLDSFSNIEVAKEQGGLELPLKFGVLNQRDKYYEITNMICDTLAQKTPDGIRYSSCYIPLETVGIKCSDYNIVLYSEGISKIKFLECNVMTNNNRFCGADILKTITGKYDFAYKP